MSVIVLGMDYPSSCCECELCYDLMGCGATGEYFYKGGLAESGFDSCNDRLPNCPLRPLPDHHSRLIDADVLENDMFELWKKNEISNSDWIGFREILKDQETILETEIQDRRVNSD